MWFFLLGAIAIYGAADVWNLAVRALAQASGTGPARLLASTIKR